MKRQHIPFLLLPASLLLLGILSACKKQQQTVTPVYKPMVEAVYASGSVVPRNQYQVFALADGYLIEKAVEEGQEVKSNQVLFSIDNQIQGIKLQNALENYRLAQQNYGADSPELNELEANLQSAKAKFQNDSINYIRYKNLLASNATTLVVHDQAYLNYQTSRNDYYALKRRYQSRRSQLLNALQQAESQYKLASEENSYYSVRSGMDGLVYEIYKEQGELIRKGEPIAMLGEKEKYVLKLAVDELDISKVKVGQEVDVVIDAMRDKILKAKIEKIYPILNKKDQSFTVDAVLDEPMDGLYAGLTLEGNIIIRKKDKALTIPKSALVGKDSVRVQREKGTELVKIRKGAENLEMVEVLGGISSEDILIIE
jgi:HlyD family secretion protein